MTREGNRVWNSTTQSMKTTAPPKTKGLTISVKDTGTFKEIIEVTKAFTNDERVSEEVRQEYIDSLKDVIDRHRSE